MASLMPQGKQAYFDSAGDPLSGGLVYTYAAGTSTPLATYSDQAGTIPNANPVVLNARGEATIFWAATGYKVSLHDAADATVWTQDGLYPEATAADIAVLAPLASPAFTGTPTGLGPSTITATGSTTARSLAARFADEVNVKDFGAVGNGVADDTAAIQAAINAVSSAGGRVKFPAGTYLCSGITVAASGVVLQGAVSATTVIKLTAAGAKVQFGNGGPSFIFGSGLRDIIVQGNNVANVGIEMNYTSECLLRSFRSDNCVTTGLLLTRSSIDRFDEFVVGDAATDVDLVNVTHPVFSNGNLWNAGTAHMRLRTVYGLTVRGTWFELAPTSILMDNTAEEVYVEQASIEGSTFIFNGGGADGSSTNRLLKIISSTAASAVRVHRLDIARSRVRFELRPQYAVTLAFAATHASSNLFLGLAGDAFTFGPTVAVVESDTALLKLDYGSNYYASSIAPLSGSGTVTGVDASGFYGGTANTIRSPLHYTDAAGSTRDFIWQSAGVSRHILRVSGAESGGNAGALMEFIPRADDGSTLGTALAIYRDTPRVLLTKAVIGSSGGATITRHLSGTATWDPANVADGANTSTTVTVTNAAVGDTVSVGFSQAVPAGALLVGAVTASNTVTVTLQNHTGAPLDLASGTLRADVWQH